MTHPTYHLNGGHHLDEVSLQDGLINRTVIMWAVFASATYAAILARSRIVGWQTRDAILLLFVVSGIAVALCRRRMSTRQKSGFLIAVNFASALTSMYTIGLLAGGIWCFPISAVVVSTYYRKRTVIAVVALSMATFCLIALGFTSGRFHMTSDATLLAYSPAHWLTYLFCFVFSLAIICDTIFTYRRSVLQLLSEMKERSDELATKNKALEDAISNVKLLQGLLPICCHCKKIRDDKGYWEQIEAYISRHTEATFSHGICDDCLKRFYPDLPDEN